MASLTFKFLTTFNFSSAEFPSKAVKMSTHISTNSKFVHNVLTAGAGVVVVLGTEATSFLKDFIGCQ